ncbi:winged helix-turn-helix transcriptional regulator [Oceanibacterium hippocampi]|uniref:Putative HTH-type transcriptional regulator YybR n=1 Tax=Oceanibacterium hippocampi TaxID=745714 RepID=A0A1Y5U1U1_9PROT|nr:helix-turn-helix domain-containing protein [Oceanibacterium hippocampi]SLN74438.1 putative HTH-type transcriptional regulator YybR [Oceanibacterium hippocampi]
MSRADLATKTCTIARAIALVGDEWTMMILREMFLGTRRFDDFLHQTGMSSHLLSRRLKKLEAEGVIRREAYSERPPRHDYRLTAKGRGLWPVVIAMKQWGDRWLGDGVDPVEIVHKACGHVTRPHMTCPECGVPMDARDAEPRLSRTFHNERQAARSHS